jgi:nicotinate-nucleotide adenylyltransferase
VDNRLLGPVTPLAVPPGPVLLFGGLFDPPHLAHTRLASAARDQVMPGAWLVFVPAARSPLKLQEPAASDLDRLHMLRLAIASIPDAGIWLDEIVRFKRFQQPSYWVDTVRRFDALRQPDEHPRFIIGADQALQFHKWHEQARIREFAAPVVLLRAPAETPDALIAQLRATGAWTEEELGGWRQAIVPLEVVEPSSTQARELLASGHTSEAAQLLDPAVFRYIEEHGLYRPRDPERPPAG